MKSKLADEMWEKTNKLRLQVNLMKGVLVVLGLAFFAYGLANDDAVPGLIVLSFTAGYLTHKSMIEYFSDKVTDIWDIRGKVDGKEVNLKWRKK